jgi:glycosyltransferase involved in cell wall biosynthesis
MLKSYYAIFRAPPGVRAATFEQPIGTKLTWWRPTWSDVFPPHHANARFFVLWLLDRLRIFRNDGYAVLIIEDERGRLIHRTCILPAWFQFPFMRPMDLQLGDVFTTASWRRRRVGVFAVRYCLERLSLSAGCIYYVAQTKNISSHKLALRAGLNFFTLARKRPTKQVGFYSLIPGRFDYSMITAIAHKWLSPLQVQNVIAQYDVSPASTAKERFHSRIGSSVSRKMRILAVIPASNSPAMMVFAHRQMAAMAAHGHTVEVFELPSRRNVFTLFGSLRAYRRRLREFEPDVVHAHYGAMTAFFSVFGAKGLAPVVVTFRGSDLNPVPSMPAWKVAPSHCLSRFAALGAAHVVCVSDELRNRLWLARKKAALIPTGVDTNSFYPLPREQARRSLGWDRDTPTVLFNAGASPRVKRIDLAQKVIEIAGKSIKDIRFVVLDGTIRPEKVPTLMRASDCLLFTSDFEGSPTVIQEAMACNLPIVSVPVGDVPERIADVAPSYLVPRDPPQLAEALVRILRDRPRSNGYEIALRELGNEAITEQLEQVYAEAAASA